MMLSWQTPILMSFLESTHRTHIAMKAYLLARGTVRFGMLAGLGQGEQAEAQGGGRETDPLPSPLAPRPATGL